MPHLLVYHHRTIVRIETNTQYCSPIHQRACGCQVPTIFYLAPTETRTRVSGFKVPSDNRYTIRASRATYFCTYYIVCFLYIVSMGYQKIDFGGVSIFILIIHSNLPNLPLFDHESNH